MRTNKRVLALLAAALLTCGFASEAAAQYPVAMDPIAIAPEPYAMVPVQPVSPVVVGYTAERRGLFGRRVVYRSVMTAPLAVPVAPVTVARPVAVARPVVVARPAVVAPVRTYRVPVVPVYGW